MKKLFTAITAIVVTVAAFAQPTQPQLPLSDFVQKRQTSDELSNEQVAKYLEMSKEGLHNSGVADLDKVYPGQFLIFNFTFDNGTTGTITHFVEDGDNVWNIIKFKLAALIRQKNAQPVPYVDPEENRDEDENTPPKKADEANMVPGVGWIFGIDPRVWWSILAVSLLFFVVKFWKQIGDYITEQRQRISDSIAQRQQERMATDHPIVPGGVSDAQAVTHMDRQVAQRQGVTRFGPVKKGRLTTFYKLRLLFANGGRNRRLVKCVVFSCKARRNSDGTECDIAYTQICGNDAGIIDMSRAIFEEDVVQSPALQAANQVVVEESASNNGNSMISDSPATIATIINAVTEPMKGKDSGKLKVRVGSVEIEMEFNSAPKTQNLLLNGTNNKEQIAPAEVVAS
jgi:hypothetical protein